MAMLKKMLAYVRTMWERMERPYRVAVAMTAVVMVVLLLWGLTTMTRDGYVRLVDNKDSEVTKQVKDKLTELNFRYYEVRSDGIYVPLEKRDELLLDTAEAMGERLYDFLREANLTVSQWQLQQSLHVANQRKLERMIARIASIRRVNLKITPQSKDRRFGFGGDRASAAITVELLPGKEFTRANTVAVSHLVSAAVEGMKPEDVMIMDTAGRLYRIPPEGSGWAEAASLNDVQKAYQQSLEESVRKIWDDAKVSAWVKVSGKRVESKEKKYGEDPREFRREKETLERSGGTDALPASIKVGGQPDLTNVASAGTKENEERTRSDTTAGFDTTEIMTHTPPGTIEESSITVVFPQFAKTGEAPPAVSDAERAERAQMISNATGVEIPKISVGFMLVTPIAELAGPTGWEQFREFMRDWGGTLFLWGLALAGVITLYFILRRAMPKDVMSEMEEMRKRLEAEAAIPVGPEGPVVEQELGRMKLTIRDMVSKNPRGVAGVLRKWITGK